jgi:HSP20 family protein
MMRRHSGFLLPVQQWRGEMDRLFSDFFGRTESSPLTRGRGFPPVNVWEDGDNLLIEAELPGVKSEDLDISVVGGELTIKGQRTGGEDGMTYHRRERTTGEFARVLRLPVEVNSDRVNAALDNGVLLITLPKSEAAKPRRVQVKAGK